MVFSQHWALLSACQGARASNNSVVEMYITWSFILCILVWNIDQLCPIDIVHFRVCIVLVSAKLLGGTIDGYRAVSSHNLTTKHRVFSLWPSLTKWRSAEKLHPSWSNTCSIVPAKKKYGIWCRFFASRHKRNAHRGVQVPIKSYFFLRIFFPGLKISSFYNFHRLSLFRQFYTFCINFSLD